MKRLAFLCVAAALSLAAGPALAGKVSVKTTHYEITGKTGAALIDAMDRKGPKHGFLTRAIAQTRYSVGWDLGWTRRGKSCAVSSVSGKLDITYVYPKLSAKASPVLKRGFAQFMRGVQKHEEMHGALARQMLKAAEKSVARLKVDNDPNCTKARAETKRRINRVYDAYEARQIRFDDDEHREGGHVEKLVVALMKAK